MEIWIQIRLFVILKSTLFSTKCPMIFLNNLCPNLGHRFKGNFPNRKVNTELSHFSHMSLGGTRLTHFNGWLPGLFLFLFFCKSITSRVNQLPESF